jgi:hypothetical protein
MQSYERTLEAGTAMATQLRACTAVRGVIARRDELTTPVDSIRASAETLLIWARWEPQRSCQPPSTHESHLAGCNATREVGKYANCSEGFRKLQQFARCKHAQHSEWLQMYDCTSRHTCHRQTLSWTVLPRQNVSRRPTATPGHCCTHLSYAAVVHLNVLVRALPLWYFRERRTH